MKLQHTASKHKVPYDASRETQNQGETSGRQIRAEQPDTRTGRTKKEVSGRIDPGETKPGESIRANRSGRIDLGESIRANWSGRVAPGESKPGRIKPGETNRANPTGRIQLGESNWANPNPDESDLFRFFSPLATHVGPCGPIWTQVDPYTYTISYRFYMMLMLFLHCFRWFYVVLCMTAWLLIYSMFLEKWLHIFDHIHGICQGSFCTYSSPEIRPIMPFSIMIYF